MEPDYGQYGQTATQQYAPPPPHQQHSPPTDIDQQVAETERQLQMLEEELKRTMMEVQTQSAVGNYGDYAGGYAGGGGGGGGGPVDHWDGESDSGSENDWWNQPTPFIGCGDPPPTKLMLQDQGGG
eukprot:6465362-Amphidinium_carterae.1